MRTLRTLRTFPDVYTYRYILPRMAPHWFQILLALADHDLHGLAITKEVFDRTGGEMQLWPGMLYGALRKMTTQGYVVETRVPQGFTSGGGHNLPRGISDMTVTKLSPSQIRLQWNPITLDLGGLLNPAKTYRLYSSTSVFGRAQISSMTPLTSQVGTVITLAMPPETLRFYFVLSEDARGNQSPS